MGTHRALALIAAAAAACGSPPNETDARVLVLIDGGADATAIDANAADANGDLLPDLTVNASRARVDLAIEQRYFSASSCELDPAEACINGEGTRTLLRFAVETPNLGTADLVLGAPTGDNDNFVYSECHDHFHFEGYAEYALLDEDDMPVSTGRKQAFCLLDSSRYVTDDPTVSTTPSYTCVFQGIQRGWSDVYDTRLPCQFIDVTGVPDGDYTLRVSINNEQTLDELDVSNNTVDIPVSLGDSELSTPTESCPAVDAHSSSGQHRECGWQFKGKYDCTPGSVIRIGCSQACSGLGSCTGDPMLRVCESNRPDGNCSDPAAIGRSDDSCNSQCPRVRDLICPSGGKIDVFAAPYANGELFTCEIEMQYQ